MKNYPNPLQTSGSLMHTLANSKDQDNVAFHQGLHYLSRQKQSSEKEIQSHFGNYNLSSLNIYNGLSQSK